MSNEPFDSERRQAEHLDEWITAAQAGDPPQNNTVAELRKFVEIGRAIRADETFARRLEAQLLQQHRQRRRVARWRWSGAAAAVLLTIFLAVGALRVLRTNEQPTRIVPSMTSVALAATSTLAVDINLTESAMSAQTSAGSVTATPTPPPLVTFPPGSPVGTNTPVPMVMTSRPSATPPPTVPLRTPTPLAVATIVPAVNPTAPSIFPSSQLDVLFLVDSGTGVDELKNGLIELAVQITQPDTRYGLVLVGKDGVQTVDFTSDVGVLRVALQAAEVDENSPGAWAAMLNEAAAGVSWREDAAARRIIIGLASQHPGGDYTPYLKEMNAQGILLHIIVLGEVDEQDASIFRDMAQVTGGHFAVLDESGYTLNEWIVQWITVLRSG